MTNEQNEQNDLKTHLIEKNDKKVIKSVNINIYLKHCDKYILKNANVLKYV